MELLRDHSADLWVLMRTGQSFRKSDVSATGESLQPFGPYFGISASVLLGVPTSEVDAGVQPMSSRNTDGQVVIHLDAIPVLPLLVSRRDLDTGAVIIEVA